MPAQNDPSSFHASFSTLHPFGAGSRTCIGYHLALMEMRYAVALFFRKDKLLKTSSDKELRLAQNMCDDMMAMENFFLIQPKARSCFVSLE